VIFAFSHISHTSRILHFCASRILACFAFRIYRVFCVLASFASHAFRVSDSSRFHASHELCTSRDPTQFVIRALAYLTCFAYFAFSRFSRFDMRYRVPPWDPSHSIRMSCPHPPRSIGAYLTWFHSHYITYVLAFTFMFIYLIMCLYYITLVCLALLTRLRGLGTRLAC